MFGAWSEFRLTWLGGGWGSGWVLSLEMIAIPYYRTRNPAAVSDGNPLIHETLADFAAEN